jgi:endonuclease VIII
MPEGDTIFRTARRLQQALAGRTITRFESVMPGLAGPAIPERLRGRQIESVRAHGKWLVIHLSGDLGLLTHMRMHGSWHVYRPGERWQRSRAGLRILIEADAFVAVAFEVPVAELLTGQALARHPALLALGPDLLDETFDAQEAARRIREQGRRPINEVLLDQRVLAGVGNVFKSEVLFAVAINPLAPAGLLDDAQLSAIVSTARRLLRANVQEETGRTRLTWTGYRRTTGRADPRAALWVYGRTGQGCRRCGTPIVAAKQGADARLTFWCPQCQGGPRSTT